MSNDLGKDESGSSSATILTIEERCQIEHIPPKIKHHSQSKQNSKWITNSKESILKETKDKLQGCVTTAEDPILEVVLETGALIASKAV